MLGDAFLEDRVRAGLDTWPAITSSEWHGGLWKVAYVDFDASGCTRLANGALFVNGRRCPAGVARGSVGGFEGLGRGVSHERRPFD